MAGRPDADSLSLHTGYDVLRKDLSVAGRPDWRRTAVAVTDAGTRREACQSLEVRIA